MGKHDRGSSASFGNINGNGKCNSKHTFWLDRNKCITYKCKIRDNTSHVIKGKNSKYFSKDWAEEGAWLSSETNFLSIVCNIPYKMDLYPTSGQPEKLLKLQLHTAACLFK